MGKKMQTSHTDFKLSYVDILPSLQMKANCPFLKCALLTVTNCQEGENTTVPTTQPYTCYLSQVININSTCEKPC